MSVSYQDYYKILGIERGAEPDNIKKAYRKLARKYHPDVNTDADAETRFKEIAEAYDVLKDPEKRKLYDQLGANWKAGQDFKPPPDWDSSKFSGQGRDGFQSFEFRGDHSDFFESLFGGHYHSGGRRQQTWNLKGRDHEADIDITLEEAFHGATKTLSLQNLTMDEKGQVHPVTISFEVRIPAGVTDRTRLRLAGKGGEGLGNGKPGDLYLKIHLLPHHRYKVDGHDLFLELPVTPWEAVLGGDIPVQLMDGAINLKIKPRSQSGKKMRLKGKGLPNRKKGRGDLFVQLKIVIPEALGDKEKGLYAELAKVSTHTPRDN